MITAKATRRKSVAAKAATERDKVKRAAKTVRMKLKPVNRRLVTVRLIGTSPLIQHRWTKKAIDQIRKKQTEGKKTKEREIKNPEEEGRLAGYYTEDGKPGILAVAIKKSVIEAAHNDIGIPKTLVSKSLFVYPMGREVVLPLEHPNDRNGRGRKRGVKQCIEEDAVRVQGSADLRYRPYYYEWAVITTWEMDVDLLRIEDFLILLDRAGFGVGLHEQRPEKKGEYGRYRVDDKFPVRDEPFPD
jgi:hypothetical protein